MALILRHGSRRNLLFVLPAYLKTRNLIIIDSDSISVFILQRSIELLAPTQQFNMKILASIRDFQTDLRSGNAQAILKSVDWIIVDSKYLWYDQAILIDVLQLVQNNAPHIRRILTAEFFSGNIFNVMQDQKLIDEVILKPISQNSLRNLVSKT